MPDVLGFMRKAFPVFSAFASFGGPLGTLAAGMAGKALGVKALDTNQDAIAAAIAGATPEQMVQLRQAEAERQAKNRAAPRGKPGMKKKRRTMSLQHLTEIFAGVMGGFVLGVAFAGNVKQELLGLHEKADAILKAVRGH